MIRVVVLKNPVHTTHKLGFRNMHLVLLFENKRCENDHSLKLERFDVVIWDVDFGSLLTSKLFKSPVLCW